MKQLLTKCPKCGFDTIDVKTVEKVIVSGGDTALLKVEAEVCSHCGERFYSPDSMELFDKIRERLSNGEPVGKPVGKVFQIV